MKNPLIYPLLIVFAAIVVSCSNGKGELLTERIQYDVTIKSPEADLAWFVQNLEGPKREKLIQSIMDAARGGKFKVYDVMTNKPMTTEEALAVGTRSNMLTLQRPYEPYENYDTIITRELQLSDISRMRFLEEWYMNEKSGLITKKVIAICPVVESYTEAGELRGYQPLFWISYVKNFPLANK